MKLVEEIGQPSWSISEIEKSIPEFLEIYQDRPFKENDGGMKAPHMFATWFMVKELNPLYVIESGVWKGLGTWIIEKAVSRAKIFAIDPSPAYRIYNSPNADYFQKDFSSIDWSIIEDKEQCLLFFDDHQNALQRVRKAKEFGFRHLIFEDNYPPKQGDCYSLKKAFAHAGFNPGKGRITGVKSFIKSLRHSDVIPPNDKDAQFLKKTLDIYYEFPPVVKSEFTRWGDKWSNIDYPTKAPVFNNEVPEKLKLFEDEAKFYTWICYAKLN